MMAFTQDAVRLSSRPHRSGAEATIKLDPLRAMTFNQPGILSVDNGQRSADE
jgi:hypothetical protein